MLLQIIMRIFFQGKTSLCKGSPMKTIKLWHCILQTNFYVTYWNLTPAVFQFDVIFLYYASIQEGRKNEYFWAGFKKYVGYVYSLSFVWIVRKNSQVPYLSMPQFWSVWLGISLRVTSFLMLVFSFRSYRWTRWHLEESWDPYGQCSQLSSGNRRLGWSWVSGRHCRRWCVVHTKLPARHHCYYFALITNWDTISRLQNGPVQVRNAEE